MLCCDDGIFAPFVFSNCTPAPKRRESVMKPIAKLRVDFARAVVVKSAKRQTVVDQQMTIGDVERSHRHGIFLAKFLAERKIDLGMAGEIRVRKLRVRRAVREAGAVIDITRRERMPGKTGVCAHVERVALVVFERGETGRRLAGRCRGWNADQSAGDRSRALSHL